MREHRYDQYCGLAQALDIVGDRWALLIVRELRPGGRRFTDLIDGLPGVSRKLLTERLRDLERDGVVVRKELPPPAARQVYELTDDGHDLAAAMVPLIGWGARRLGEQRRQQSFRPRWAAVAMASFADSDAAKGIKENYQYVVGDTTFYFVVDDGSIDVRDGRAEESAVLVTTDEDTWAAIGTGKTSVASAVAAGLLSVSGDQRAAKRLGKIFSRKGVLARASASAG